MLRKGRSVEEVARERRICESTVWSYLVSAAKSFSEEEDLLLARKIVPARAWDALLSSPGEERDDRLSSLMERVDKKLGSRWTSTPHRGSILCFARSALRSVGEARIVRPD